MAKEVDQLALWITYVNVGLFALCYELQRPIEPFLVKQLTEFAEVGGGVLRSYGRLQSCFSVIQTVGSPLVGILMDRSGIRMASAAVFASSAASYAILANTSDLRWLYYSKIPAALQHAFLVAQATAAASTVGDASARAQAFSRMTTAYTLGATIGPALGGYLASQGDLYIGARVAVIASLLSVFLSIFFLPNVSYQKGIENGMISLRKGKFHFVENLKHLGDIAVRFTLWPLLLLKVIGDVSSSMHSTALPVVMTEKLHFDPSVLGLSMSISIFLVAAFGVAGMRPTTRILGLSGTTRASLVIRILLGLAMTTIVFEMTRVDITSEYRIALQNILVLSSVCHSLASQTLSTGLTAQSNNRVEKQEQGALLGLEHALFSFTRIAGPLVGMALLDSRGNFWSLEIACVGLDLCLVLSLVATTTAHKEKII